MITVVLVDDQEVVRAGLRMLATKDGDIEIIGEAADGRSGIDESGLVRPGQHGH